MQQEVQELVFGQPLKLVKRFDFEAAHLLPFHAGKCSQLHGHSYVLEVEVMGIPRQINDRPEIDSAEGMVVDFADISGEVKSRIINRFDHHFLASRGNGTNVPNAEGVVHLPIPQSTAECLVQYIVSELWESQDYWGAALTRVRLWETATGYAEWNRSNKS